MQTPKASPSSEAPQRVSPRAVRQFKPAAVEVESASSSSKVNRAPKDKSPKTVERRSPRSPASERKRPSRFSEFEYEISQLQEDLKKTRNQLSLAESWKKQAQQEAEESKEQLLAMSRKFEVSQKQLLELSASKKIYGPELQETSQDQDQASQVQLEAVQEQCLLDSSALISAIAQIQGHKVQLDIVESENAQTKHTELGHSDLQSLKGNLAETLALVEKMKNLLPDGKDQDATVQVLANKTLLQLESAKQTIEVLSLDGMKAFEAYNAVASELDQSRGRVTSLEGLVSQLQADLNNLCHKPSQNSDIPLDHLRDTEENQNTTKESNQLKAELCTLKSEVERLRSALKASEIKQQEAQIQSAVQVTSTHELVDQIQSESTAREVELEVMLDKTKANVEELKAMLMDKETELQGITEENKGLNLKLTKGLSSQRVHELEKELEQYKENAAELKANLAIKEKELQSILEENEMLRSEIKRSDMDKGKATNEIVAEVEVAKAAEREALVKLGIVMEEADKSNRTAARVNEQLEAVQAVNSEMEAELRRLKVQSDQWRKAAEAALAMLSAGDHGNFTEKTGPKFSSPYYGDLDDDLTKKKNGNKLKKFGGLWKRPQK